MAKPFEDLYRDFEQKGRKEERKEIAKRLLQDGTEVSFIMKVTQLTEQEINELMQNQ